MIRISQRVAALAQSATLAMSQKSSELIAEGIDIVNMSVGEPDFNTAGFIKEAAKKAIDNDFSRYTPVAGYLSLRQAICRKLKRENNLDYRPEQIVVGNGAKQALCNVLLAVVDPGDEVIIPTPAWVSYMEMVRLSEGKVVEVPVGIDHGFKITPELLRRAITPATKVVMLNSPSNPTGAVYSRPELAALAEVLAEYPDILILTDDIYEHISYVGKVASIAEFPQVGNRTVVVNGVSKAYAMTGWRIGYMAGPEEVAAAVCKLQGQYTSGPSSIAQKAAEAAYDGEQHCVEEMREAFEHRRDLIVRLASEIPGWRFLRPDGAFYLFPDVTYYIGKTRPDGIRIDTSADYVMYLLEEAHVAVVDGASFGAPGYVRLSYACSESDIKKAMKRISDACARLT